MKERIARRGAAALADCLMLFLGLYGTVFCLISAFSLPVDSRAVTGVCLLCAPLFTAVFALPRRWARGVLYLGWAVATAVTVWRRLELMTLGALVLARQVVDTVARAVGSSVTLDITVLTGATTPEDEAAAITALFLLLTVTLAFWIGWLWQRMRSFWLTFWGTFPLLTLPLSITITPDWTPLMALLLFWGAGLLARQSNKRDPSGSAGIVLPVLPLCALLLAGLGLALPQEEYQRANWAEAARLEIIDRLSAVGRDVAGAGADLGLAGGSDRIDLSQAGPLDFDGNAALRVRSGATGHIYLRGFSSAVYTGGGWEQLSDETYRQMREGWEVLRPAVDAVYEEEISGEPFAVEGVGDYQPINFPAMADMSSASTRIEVENVGAADRFVYTPYQLSTTPERMTGAEFVGDAYLARGAGTWTHVLYARQGASPLRARLTGDAAQAEEHYRLFVYRNYLQIPDELGTEINELTEGMEAWAARLLSSQVITVPLGTPFFLVQAQYVGAYLSSIAVYDPDTPAPPDGMDFVTHFLTEGRGYCMHFATTATLLLRSMGVPARYVSGYVADTVAGEWVDVPDYNAHAWVEVYLEGYGWQPVEVTPGYDGTFAWEQEPEAPPAPTETQTAEPAPTPTPTESQPPLPSHTGEQPEGQKPAQPSLWAGWLVVPAGLALSAAGLVLRRRLAARRRARRFGQQDAGRAVIEMYLYVEKLCSRTGAAMDGTLEALAKKAAFSAHTLTEEERAAARILTEQAAEAADRSRRGAGRLVFRYILGLY